MKIFKKDTFDLEIENEIKILSMVHNLKGFPKFIDHGSFILRDKEYYFIIQEKLGKNL